MHPRLIYLFWGARVYREVHPLEWKTRMIEFLCKPG
jgi:hypothetical protein